MAKNTKTEWSKVAGAIGGTIEGITGSPFAFSGLPLGMFGKDKESGRTPKELAIVLTLAAITLPIGLALAPVTAPVLAVVCARNYIKENCYHGDLSPESDDEPCSDRNDETS